ncbi:MAG: DUF4298 domain-containing protein [Butyrivibrio sp.]|nr:DUF4298 domain-containing protein [Butyrivibrio sp.]
MLVFCKCALKDALSDVDAIKKLSYEISLTIKKVEANIKELEDEKCSLDKDTIKNSKECLKYLGKCKADFALDEEGKFPKWLKKGVLSEDGIYNMLERNKEIMKILDGFDS